MARIALIGDRRESVIAHRAIPLALQAAASALDRDIQWDWIQSTELTGSVSIKLQPYDGVWCIPGSPYTNTQGILESIRWARESARPFLGTCGGFQHALLEYARDVWRLDDAAHAETDPDAADPIIAPLQCALVNVAESLQLVPDTRLANIYASDRTTEEYQCSYGLNPRYAQRLEIGPMKGAALDHAGSVRAIELDTHPFFIATLFQPERAALRGAASPLVRAFAAAI